MVIRFRTNSIHIRAQVSHPEKDLPTQTTTDTLGTRQLLPMAIRKLR